MFMGKKIKDIILEAKKAIGTGTKVGVKKFIIPAVDTLVAQRPEFIPSWILVKGFYGALFDIQQEKINELVEFLKDNEGVFAKQIVETKEFKEIFVITFENYLKQRNKKKRKIIQNIFIDFSKTINEGHNPFEIERMYDLLNKMSIIDIKILKDIEKKETVKVEYNNGEPLNDYYDTFRYLEYLGLLDRKSRKEVETEVDARYNSSMATSSLNEIDFFSLSYFGECFVKFIKE